MPVFPEKKKKKIVKQATCILFPRKPVEPVMRTLLFLKYPAILLPSAIEQEKREKTGRERN
jgi:hypothetical protein